MTSRRQEQLGRWLHAAIENGRTERALELLRQGADLSVRHPDGDPVLYAAIAHHQYALVEPLLSAGADPNLPGPHGRYPIHVVAQWADEDAPRLLELLIRRGARIDLCDDEGATPMFWAGRHGTEEAIRTLQRHGADVTARNGEMDTALTFACCWGFLDRATMLLDLGIDIHAQDTGGMNALHWAAREGHADTVVLLLQRGAHVGEVDNWGTTALMYAARHGSLHTVEFLLAAGADPEARDQTGKSALDYAGQYAGRDLAEALIAEQERRECQKDEPVPIVVRRTMTAAGEPAVEVSALLNGCGWSLWKCDGFDAIVELLKARLACGQMLR